MNPAGDLVNKLWRLCAVLRKDGITYQQYVTELTYLLFLKMMAEQKDEEGRIPEDTLARPRSRRGASRLLSSTADADSTSAIGTRSLDRIVQAIFAERRHLRPRAGQSRKLIDAIDDCTGSREERDSFGDLYEGLLQKNAEETKRGAGQYFTPRVLIEVHGAPDAAASPARSSRTRPPAPAAS